MNALPDTPLVREATQLARASLTSPMFAHSIRAFLLGRAYAQARRIVFCDEDLLLAALFHDLGLTDAFRDRRRAFTEVGATLAQRFMTERAQGSRGRVLAESIAFHMQLLPRWSKGPVVGLLQVGAWMDASRVRARRVGMTRIDEIERAYPRDGFDREFRSRLRRSIGSLSACARLVVPRRRGPAAP